MGTSKGGRIKLYHEWVWVPGKSGRYTCIRCLMGSKVRPLVGCKPVSQGFLGWVNKVRSLGHLLVVTRGSEVPLLSYCKLCGKYAERAGQGLNEGCYGEPKNKNARYKLKKMVGGKHPDGGARLGEVVGKAFWEAVAAGSGGNVFRPKEGLLSWDAGVVQGRASDSGNVNVLLCGPCGVGTSGSSGGGVWGVGTGPCGAGASGSGVREPCGAGASGSGGDVFSGDEEVADLWWGDCT